MDVMGEPTIPSTGEWIPDFWLNHQHYPTTPTTAPFFGKVCPSESPNTSITSTIQRMAFLREAFALEVSRRLLEGSHPGFPQEKNRVLLNV